MIDSFTDTTVKFLSWSSFSLIVLCKSELLNLNDEKWEADPLLFGVVCVLYRSSILKNDGSALG